MISVSSPPPFCNPNNIWNSAHLQSHHNLIRTVHKFPFPTHTLSFPPAKYREMTEKYLPISKIGPKTGLKNPHSGKVLGLICLARGRFNTTIILLLSARAYFQKFKSLPKHHANLWSMFSSFNHEFVHTVWWLKTLPGFVVALVLGIVPQSLLTSPTDAGLIVSGNLQRSNNGFCRRPKLK